MSDQEQSERSNKEQNPFVSADGQAGSGEPPGESARQADLQVAFSGSQHPPSSGRQGPVAEGENQQPTRQLPGPNDSTVILDGSWLQSPVHGGSAGIINAEALGVLNQEQLMVAAPHTGFLDLANVHVKTAEDFKTAGGSKLHSRPDPDNPLWVATMQHSGRFI